MPLAHSFAVLWIYIVFLATTFALPSLVLPRVGSSVAQLAKGGLAACAFWVCAAFALSLSKCFNALTLILLGALALLYAYKQTRGSALRAIATNLFEQIAGNIATLDGLSRWISAALPTWSSLKRNRWMARQYAFLMSLPFISFCFMVVLMVVIALAGSLRFTHLNGARMTQADGYLLLLRTRELILNTHVLSRPFLFPALAAAGALLSGADPLPTVQALSALVPFLLTLAVGRVVFLLTRSLLSSAVAIYLQGVGSLAHASAPLMTMYMGEGSPLSRSASEPFADSIEIQTSLLLLMLCLTVLLERRNNPEESAPAVTTLACSLVVIASNPLFLLFVPFLFAACLSRWPKLLLSLSVGALLTGVLISTARSDSIPVDVHYLETAVSLLGALLFYGLEYALVSFGGLQTRIPLAIASAFVAATWLPPQASSEVPLEYEAVAENASAIASVFPHQRWIIAAPVEQLPEIYSLGSFEDLASFIGTVRGDDLSKAFLFGQSYDDLFIFVEKLPFVSFHTEPGSVDFPVLADSTYRNYRSPAGRASLEARTIQLCERYRSTHSDASVYFEDDSIRVYRIHLASTGK